jgi:hypothetical protein
MQAPISILRKFFGGLASEAWRIGLSALHLRYAE